MITIHEHAVERNSTAGFYLDEIDGVGISVDQFGEETRCNFPGNYIVKLVKYRIHINKVYPIPMYCISLLNASGI